MDDLRELIDAATEVIVAETRVAIYDMDHNPTQNCDKRVISKFFVPLSRVTLICCICYWRQKNSNILPGVFAHVMPVQDMKLPDFF